MKHFTDDFIHELSFPDFNVTKMVFNCPEKLIKIFIDGAIINNTNEILGAGCLMFYAWKSVYMRSYTRAGDEWKWQKNKSLEELKDLCEVELKGQKVVLRGFGKKRGLWSECEIEGGEAKAEFD